MVLQNTKSAEKNLDAFYNEVQGSQCKFSAKEVLQRAELNGDVVSIYTDMPEANFVYTGCVHSVFDNYIIFASISEEGRYDGYMVIFIEDIYQIDKGRNHEEKIQKLYNVRNERHAKIDNLYNDAYLNLLHFAYETEALIAIELYDSGRLDIEGRVEHFDPLSVCIRMFTQYGEDDGVISIGIDSISRLECDTQYINSFEILEEEGALNA